MLAIIKAISFHSLLKPVVPRYPHIALPCSYLAPPSGYSLSETGVFRFSLAGALCLLPSLFHLEQAQTSLIIFSCNSIPPHLKDVRDMMCASLD